MRLHVCMHARAIRQRVHTVAVVFFWLIVVHGGDGGRFSTTVSGAFWQEV